MSGLQRECPRCGELSRPDGRVCMECGTYLVPVQRVELDASEREHFRRIMGRRSGGIAGGIGCGTAADTAHQAGRN